MCRLKKHAYAGLPPSENHASQGKNVRTNTRNSAFPRALFNPSLQINYDADFFHLEWTHEEISSLHVYAVFITGLCHHSFVFSPFSRSIYKWKNQIFSALI